MKTTFAFIMLAFFNAIALAQFPKGCEVRGFGYDDNHLVLNNSAKQEFYLIQNQSDNQIILEHIANQNSFFSPSLKITLNPKRWAAFASDIANFQFQCISATDAILNCNDVLEVCQYPRVKFALSNMGNYWVASDKSQTAIINETAKNGILLRW